MNLEGISHGGEVTALLSLEEARYRLINGELSDGRFTVDDDGSKNISEAIRKLNILGCFYGASFCAAERVRQEYDKDKYLPVLQKYWGSEAGIRNGTYSIVYLSPEFLLAWDISTLTGGRTVGLMVIDEAHLVTSWGRDFRADYWFLGDYIENIRHATHDKKKAQLAVDAVLNYVRNSEKAIIYFPFTSQVNEVYTDLVSYHTEEAKRTRKYYGGMSSLDKTESYDSFRTSRAPVMLATKAFGMGVNIGDIANVYHFAPTWTLADYVQEIGRVARTLPAGKAVTDYMKTDMRYARILWGLYGLRQYQLREMARKIYTMYTDKGHRNLLFSPETFGYLFNGDDIDNTVKNGLLLLSNDMLNMFHFNALNVRAKNLFST